MFPLSKAGSNDAISEDLPMLNKVASVIHIVLAKGDHIALLIVGTIWNRLNSLGNDPV